MAAGFLVLLVLAWAAICVPAANRARHREPVASTALFKRGLELIGPDHHPEFVRTYGHVGTIGPPSKAISVRHGRLIVFLALSVGVLMSLAGAIVEGTWELHLGFVALFALFLSWLIEDKHKRDARRRRIKALERRHTHRFRGSGSDGLEDETYPSELRRAAGDG